MTSMARSEPEQVGVTQARARLSDLLTRVGRGERFVLVKRGKAVAELVPAGEAREPTSRPLGLAAVAGALADWEDLPSAIDDIVSTRTP